MLNLSLQEDINFNCSCPDYPKPNICMHSLLTKIHVQISNTPTALTSSSFSFSFSNSVFKHTPGKHINTKLICTYYIMLSEKDKTKTVRTRIAATSTPRTGTKAWAKLQAATYSNNKGKRHSNITNDNM